MPANHRTMHGYAPLLVAELIARVEAEHEAERSVIQWPTSADLACACVAYDPATRRNRSMPPATPVSVTRTGSPTLGNERFLPSQSWSLAG